MSIAIRCPNCKKSLTVPDEAVGKMASCPACQTAFAIAQPAEEIIPTVIAAPAAAWDKESLSERRKRAEKKRRARDDDGDEDEEEEESIPEPASPPQPTGPNPFALDNDQDDTTRPPWRPHRGGLILALGIVTIVSGCLPLAFVTISMANVDLIEMAAQRMDPEGRGQTKTGKMLAVISLLLMLVSLPFFCCLGILTSGKLRF